LDINDVFLKTIMINTQPSFLRTWERFMIRCNKGGTAAIVAGAIIVVVVIIFAIIFVMPYMFQKSGTVKVTVCSTHLLVNITYELYEDNNLVKTGDLTWNECDRYTFTVYWPSNANSRNVTYSADSEGGLLGPVHKSSSVTLHDKESVDIELKV
jgi:hypothetical protein